MESPERPCLSCFTSTNNPDSAKGHSPDPHEGCSMLSAYHTLPEISTSMKVVFLLIVCEAPQECQSHVEEAAV